MTMKRAVVTGGAGFIGSHVADELAARGYAVSVIDNLSTGRKENIAGLLQKANTEFIEGSITDLPLLNKVFQGAHFVFHLAAIPSVPRSIKNPQASHEVNTTGTLNVLIAARDCQVGKVVYASSSSVYGDTPTLPKQEDMIPNPKSPYAVGKLTGEYYCKVFQEVYGLKTAALRYFNVFGPRQDPGSEYAAVVPKFTKKCLEGKSPIIFDDGEQTRDFTFVRDTVAATVMAAESGATGVFNVATGSRVTVNELARLIIQLTGKDVKPEYQPARTGDIKHSLADISRAKAFGYSPRHTLLEGLRETVKYAQARY